MNRPPPSPVPPKFVIGSKVRLNMRTKGATGVGTIIGLKQMSKEDLVRTAYAAGFWIYTVRFASGELAASGNLLDLAIIETLGGLADASRA